jgi:hypothetical protein
MSQRYWRAGRGGETKTKQNKTKQNKTKQNKTKQNKTKQKEPLQVVGQKVPHTSASSAAVIGTAKFNVWVNKNHLPFLFSCFSFRGSTVRVKTARF